MPVVPQRILTLEGRPGDGARIEQVLMHAPGVTELMSGTYELVIAPACGCDIGQLMASQAFDAVLLCLGAGLTDPAPLIAQLLDAAPYAPIVAIADEADDELALRAVCLGTQDYLLWNELTARSLARAIRASIERCWAKQQIAESRLSIVWRLAKAAECRDEVTGNHVVRVGCYSKILAEALGMDRQFVEAIFVTAPLHDIGKIGIPDAILRKPGPLTAQERAVMQMHCEIGERILRDDSKAMGAFRAWRGLHPHGERFEPVDSLLEMACTVSLTHHERWDGRGYPRGLAGEQIPLVGRIVAMSDVFDALLSERPYKRAYSEDEALAILEQEVGRQFDPEIYAALLRSLDDMRQVREEFNDSHCEEHELPFVLAPDRN